MLRGLASIAYSEGAKGYAEMLGCEASLRINEPTFPTLLCSRRA